MDIKVVLSDSLPLLVDRCLARNEDHVAYPDPQVAYDADGSTVGAGDYAAQVEQAYLNVATALAAVGGTFDDVVRVTMFIVDWSPDKTSLLAEGIARAGAKLGATPVPPLTGIGVSVLAGPDLLVEVEATAMLD